MKPLSSREILLSRDPFKCLTRRLDAVEQVTAVRWEKPHDLVLPGRRRHADTSRVEIDNLPDFEFVLSYSICLQLPVLPTRIWLTRRLILAKTAILGSLKSQSAVKDRYLRPDRPHSDARLRLLFRGTQQHLTPRLGSGHVIFSICL